MVATFRKLRLQTVQNSMEQKLGLVDWLRSAQLALGWAAVLVILAVAAAIVLHQVSQTALISRNAQIIRGELNNLRRENTSLRLRIAEAQAETARQQAGQLMSQPATEAQPAVEYLTVSIAPADPAPTDSAPADPIVPNPPETFGGALAGVLRAVIGALFTGVSRGR